MLHRVILLVLGMAIMLSPLAQALECLDEPHSHELGLHEHRHELSEKNPLDCLKTLDEAQAILFSFKPDVADTVVVLVPTPWYEIVRPNNVMANLPPQRVKPPSEDVLMVSGRLRL